MFGYNNNKMLHLKIFIPTLFCSKMMCLTTFYQTELRPLLLDFLNNQNVVFGLIYLMEGNVNFSEDLFSFSRTASFLTFLNMVLIC